MVNLTNISAIIVIIGLLSGNLSDYLFNCLNSLNDGVVLFGWFRCDGHILVFVQFGLGNLNQLLIKLTGNSCVEHIV